MASKKSSPGLVGSLVSDLERSMSAFLSEELLPERWRFAEEPLSFSLPCPPPSPPSLPASGFTSLMVGRLRGERERWSFMRSKPEVEVGVPGGVTFPLCCC